MPAPTEIDARRLVRLVGTVEAPALIDARTAEDFEADPRLLPGAIRLPFRPPGREAQAAVPSLRGRRAVVYRQRGLKASQGVAALLRAEGVPAETLEVSGSLPLSALPG